MLEPYYEDIKINNPHYPYSCSITESRSGKIIINPHWHDHIELLYFLCGTAEVYYGGEHITAAKGDLIIVNAHEIHYINSPEGVETRYIVIKFDPAVLQIQQTVFELKYVYPFTLNNFKQNRVFTGEELDKTDIPGIIGDLYREFMEKSYGFELAVQSCIYAMMLWILRYWRVNGLHLDMPDILNGNNIRTFENLLNYIEKNYKNEITLKEAARMSNMSYYYFPRQFKKVMGCTFLEYLNYIRIREAERLLTTTNMNITQAAVETGFSDSSYFIKQFRRQKGISPKKYVGQMKFS